MGSWRQQKINCRKLQILVDVLGWLWKVKFHTVHQYDSLEDVDLIDGFSRYLLRFKKSWAVNPMEESLLKQWKNSDWSLMAHSGRWPLRFCWSSQRWFVKRSFGLAKFFRQVISGLWTYPSKCIIILAFGKFLIGYLVSWLLSIMKFSNAHLVHFS